LWAGAHESPKLAVQTVFGRVLTMDLKAVGLSGLGLDPGIEGGPEFTYLGLGPGIDRAPEFTPPGVRIMA